MAYRLGPFRETSARSGATISNQILRHQGELPSEIGEIERRAGGRGEAGQNSFRADRFCVTASASKTCMVRTAPRRKRHRGREIVLDAKEALVRRDRLYRPDQQDRRWFVAHGTLRCRPYHTDQAVQGLFTTEELGDADRQARRHEQGQGGARPPTGRCHASHACRRSPLQRWSSLTGAAQQFGPVTIRGLLEAKCLRRDDGSR